MFVLAERIRKKSASGKFYKQTVQNSYYFNKKTVFNNKKKEKKNDEKTYYWLKNTKNNQYLLKRFQGNETLSIVNNFVM